MDRPLITPQMRAWADQSIARIGQLEQPLHRSARRRVAVMHLDGVPRTVLEHAIETDRMPFLSRLVKTGAFHVDGAFWGSPASTPCFQAGLLYGLRVRRVPADRGEGRTECTGAAACTPGADLGKPHTSPSTKSTSTCTSLRLQLHRSKPLNNSAPFSRPW